MGRRKRTIIPPAEKQAPAAITVCAGAARFGVRQLAAALCPASLLAGFVPVTIPNTSHLAWRGVLPSKLAGWGESGSKLPHSKASHPTNSFFGPALPNRVPRSFLPKVAAHQVNEDVFQAGLTRGEVQQVHIPRLQGGQECGNRLMGFAHTQHHAAVLFVNCLDASQ